MSKVPASREPEDKNGTKDWPARLWRRITLGGLLTTLIGFVIAIVTNYDNAATSTCTIAAMQPGLSDACGSLGLGGRPTRTERLFWQSRRPGSCEDVRRYVDYVGQHQYRGAYLTEASALLAARRVAAADRFVPGTRMLSLYVMQADTAATSEEASWAKTLALAQDQATRDCRAFAQSTLFQFASAGVDPQLWQCRKTGEEVACSLEGQSVCHLLERQTSEAETCGL